MIQTAGSIALIVSVLLPIAALGVGAFRRSIDAHVEYVRYEQTHQTTETQGERGPKQ